MVDFSDILSSVEDADQQDNILREVQNMLLRHNSSLKQWYKLYSQKFENGIGEDAFSMDLQTYWRFVQESKILDASTTLASIDRIFFQGPKNSFQMKTDEGDVDRFIDLLKKIGKPLTLNELQDIDFLNLAIYAQNQELDWKNMRDIEGNVF